MGRVFDTPLTESGILGMTVELGHEGLKLILELQFSAFGTAAISEISGQISRYHYGGT